MSKLYGIGVGPGDSELVTLKAVRTMNEVDILFYPEKKKAAGGFAYNIVKQHITTEKVIIKSLVFPMHYKGDELVNKWKENAHIIEQALEEGKNVGFIILGDPTLYSTFMYVLSYIQQEKFEVEVIPGITSFSAVAARMKLPLAVWEENLGILPVRKSNREEIAKVFDKYDNIVLMKPSSDISGIVGELKKRNLEKNFVLITKCGTDEEKIISDIELLENYKVPYLSTMIIKKGGLEWQKYTL